MNTQSMTAQEIFNVVAKHLFDQNRQAFNNGCVLLTYDGLMCAVGKLVESAPIHERLNKTQSEELIRNQFPELIPHLNILQSAGDLPINAVSLMKVHDTASNWSTTDTMRFALDAVAHEFNLDNHILTTLKFKDR